jgi:hypothetical protein
MKTVFGFQSLLMSVLKTVKERTSLMPYLLENHCKDNCLWLLHYVYAMATIQ